MAWIWQGEQETSCHNHCEPGSTPRHDWTGSYSWHWCLGACILPCGKSFYFYSILLTNFCHYFFIMTDNFFSFICSTKMSDLTTSRWFGKSSTGRTVLRGLLRRRSKDKIDFGTLIFCIFPLNEFSSLATGWSYLFLDVFHFSSGIFLTQWLHWRFFDDCSCISATLCVQIFEETIQIKKKSDTKEKPNTIIFVMGKKPGHPKQSIQSL